MADEVELWLEGLEGGTRRSEAHEEKGKGGCEKNKPLSLTLTNAPPLITDITVKQVIIRMIRC